MKQYNEVNAAGTAEAHFGEKSQDKIWSYRDQYEYCCPTETTDKYEQAKKAAIAAIAKYGLSEDDFWIKKSLGQFKDKIIYENLILSHSGCIKVNEQQPEDRQFKPSCVREAKGGQDGGVALLYVSDEQRLFKTGEASPRNSRMSYLYAAAERRLFDRVVTALSGLYENGIYGEAEADSFAKEPPASESPQAIPAASSVQPGPLATPLATEIPDTDTAPVEMHLTEEERAKRIAYINKGIKFTGFNEKTMLDYYGVWDLSEMTDESLMHATSKIEEEIRAKKAALRAAQHSVESCGQAAPTPMPTATSMQGQVSEDNSGLSPIAQLIAGGQLRPASEIPQPEADAPSELPIGETIYEVTENAPKSFQDMAGQTLDQIGKEMLRGLYKRANAAGRKYVSSELLEKIEAYIA